MHITINGTLTLKEFKKLAMRQWAKHPKGWLTMALGILMLYITLWMRKYDFNAWVYYVLEIFGFYLTAAPAVYYIKLEQAYKSSKSADKAVTYIFTDEKLIIKGEGFEKQIDWGYFFYIENQQKLFLVYENISAGHMVLKHWFTPEQAQEVQAFLKELKGIEKKGF